MDQSLLRPPNFKPRPWPWPWGHKSIVLDVEENQKQQVNSWLDADLSDDEADSDYVPSSPRSGNSNYSDVLETASSDSDASGSDINDSELAQIQADALTGWRASPTGSLGALDAQAALEQRIEILVKAEEDAAASYDPNQVVSLITQFYELMVTMGHWPEGSIRYPPHTDPPVNEELATELGYPPAVISVMHKLPYPNPSINTWHDDEHAIFDETRLADYTQESYLREGRLPPPYMYIDDCPPIDAWLLPLVIPKRYGWHCMLDTKIGVIRAYSVDSVSEWTTEWVRHGRVEFGSEKWEHASRTEYRRATIIPAARYFEELIYAYYSLARLPLVRGNANDPLDSNVKDEDKEQQEILLSLYTKYGWPHNWQRAEFLAEWGTKTKEISEKWREIRSSIPNEDSELFE
ncbi:SWIM-type domain-containing protein [Favolaschia claudopus]|uniref:SWIM-type domain-containing protein n=1 Tax=Favolaschia claudopus TaxID=2862362 RepID=A0AAW0EHG7_9AGAR